MTEILVKEVSEHLGSIGLLIVAVALLWQKQSAHEESVKETRLAMWEKINDHETRISHLE